MDEGKKVIPWIIAVAVGALIVGLIVFFTMIMKKSGGKTLTTTFDKLDGMIESIDTNTN